MAIYFDQAAAMKPDGAVLDFYRTEAEACYANQEAIHGGGYELRCKLEAAAKSLASDVAPRPMEVSWAGCGTEVFQLLATLPGLKNGNIVTTMLEHPALPAILERCGAELRILPMKQGEIDWEAGRSMIDRETRLVAMVHVQSEIGRIQEFDTIRAILRENAPRALLFADTIQSAGKLTLPEVDLCSISGHKLGAPGGAALLWKPELRLHDHFGAMRHRDYRFGRPEPALMLALAFAAKLRRERRAVESERVIGINRFLRAALTPLTLPNGKKVRLTLPEATASPWILHFLLPGYQSAVVVRILSQMGIWAASGSACQAESDRPSAVLSALEFGRADAYAGMRLSFGGSNTRDEAEIFLDALMRALRDY